MDSVQIMTAVLTLCAGIGVFLTACGIMTSNLEALDSDKLRDLFASAAKSRLLGVGMGALGTAAIQSSGATTVIVIGFVNAGIMSLTQAATVIYGANIGTTITGQIVAWGISGGEGISSTVIFSALAGVGAFITSFARKDHIRTIGGILCGFGMLFVGLAMMSGAMEAFAELDSVCAFLASIKSPLMLVLIGAILTAVIQSSSVMTSVAITMVVAELITLDQGVYLTMGSNIGSCVVSLIAGMTGSANAKRSSLIHLLFNTVGVIVFMCIGWAMTTTTGGATTFGTIFESLFPGMPQIQLAMFHTVFNVIAVLLMLPFTDALVALVTRMVADDGRQSRALATYHIDDMLLMTPPIAVQQVKNEILGMAGIAMHNFEAAIDMILTQDYARQESFQRREGELDYLEHEISHYVSKLFGEQLSEADREYLSCSLNTVSDLELIGDYSEHIVDYGMTLDKADGSLSDEAQRDIKELSGMVEDLFGQAVRAYENDDEDEVTKAGLAALAISDKVAEVSASHVRRLSKGTCSPVAGTSFLGLVSDLERVAVHFYNMAKTVRGL